MRKAYRKKPVVIEAEGPITEPRNISTLEGTMLANTGDFVITGVQGEQYPCKPDIFAATYSEVVEVDDTDMKRARLVLIGTTVTMAVLIPLTAALGLIITMGVAAFLLGASAMLLAVVHALLSAND